MHELGVVFHIIDDLKAVASDNDVSSISKVTIELGDGDGGGCQIACILVPQPIGNVFVWLFLDDFADDVGVQNNHGRFLFKRYWRSGIGGISLG